MSRLRARHFRHLVLDDMDLGQHAHLHSLVSASPAAPAFLAILPHLDLASLDTITLGHQIYTSTTNAAGRLSLVHAPEHFSTNFRSQLLVSLLERVPNLNLYLRDPQDFGDVLDIARAVKTLYMHASLPRGATFDAVGTLEALPPTLENLTISAPVPLDLSGVAAVYRAGEAMWPALQALSYRGPFHPSLAAFVTLSAQSLRSFEIKCPTRFEADASPILLEHDVTFPQLRRLSLGATHWNGHETLLESLPTSGFPALQELELSCREKESPRDFEASALFDAVGRLLESHVQLRVVRLDYHCVLSPEEVVSLRRFSNNHGVRFEIGPAVTFPDLALLVPAYWRYTEDNFDDYELPDCDFLTTAVSRTVDFIADWRDRARASSAVAEWAQLAAVLRDAEFERAVMAT